MPAPLFKRRRVPLFLLIVSVAVLAVTGACAHSAGRESLYSIESRIKPATLTLGENSTATVVIRLKQGGNFSEGSPMRVLLSTTNISLKKYMLTRDDAKVEARVARFEIPFTPINRGAASITADLNFYVCTEKTCDREERQVEMTFIVK